MSNNSKELNKLMFNEEYQPCHAIALIFSNKVDIYCNDNKAEEFKYNHSFKSVNLFEEDGIYNDVLENPVPLSQETIDSIKQSIDGVIDIKSWYF